MQRKNSATSVLVRHKLYKASDGTAKTSLTSASAGLIIGTIADVEAASTAYTQAGGTIETITTLGTFAAPTATKCRFKEVDATNHPGLYEFQFADARYAVANAKSLIVSVPAVSGLDLAGIDFVVDLTTVDPYDGVRGGMTALPNAAAEAAGGLYTRGAGAGQIKQTNNGEVDANATRVNNVVTTSVTTISDHLGTVGASTAQTGDSFARIGAPVGASISADIASAKADLTTLLARLTATRAGLLDNLSNLDAAISSRSTYAGVDTAGTTTLLARLTATRAGLLDSLSNLDAAISTRLATSGYTAPPTAVQNADALLGRNIAGGSSVGRTVTSALRKLRNKVAIAAGVMTVYQEDDATSDHTEVVATTAGNPISSTDPDT